MTEGRTRVINIDDFPTKSVNQFLETLHTGKCSIAFNWSDMLLMAEKYQVPECVELGLAHMNNTLSADTVFEKDCMDPCLKRIHVYFLREHTCMRIKQEYTYVDEM